MYAFTEGDRVWIEAEWSHEESHVGHIKHVYPNGDAILMFDQWSGIVIRQDGFSPSGFFRITKHVSKSDLDATRRT